MSHRNSHSRHDQTFSPRGVVRQMTSARSMRSPALSACTPGAVVLAQVPFTDGPGYKTRPAVIVRVVGRDVQIFPITSAPRRGDFGALEIRDWIDAGLSRPSGVAPVCHTLDRVYDLVTWMGELSDRDWDAVRALRDRLAPQPDAAPAPTLIGV